MLDKSLSLFLYSSYSRFTMKTQKKTNHSEQFPVSSIPSDPLYLALFETTENLTLIFDENKIILKVNTRFAEFIGYPREDVEGKMTWMDFVVKEDQDMLVKYHALRTRSPQDAPKNYEFRVRNKNNEIILMYMTIGLIPGTTYRIASLMDITARRQLEKEIIQITEEEQRRIGFHLHDDLAPHLLGIEALLNVIKKKLVKEKSGAAGDIEKIRELLVEAVQKTRGFAKILCPVHLADYGLESAILELVRNTESVYGIKCSFTLEGKSPEGNSELAKHIFFMIKEAVHNAVKHARAKKISIFIEYNPPHLLVKIDDDGKGFNVTGTSPGIGQKIMRYRAEMIGAYFAITSSRNSGTAVQIEIPGEGLDFQLNTMKDHAGEK